MVPMSNAISIKGTREGLTITLGSGDIEILLQDLAQHLATQGAFFRGGTVALQVGERAMKEGELARINGLLAENEMILRTVVSTNAATQQVAGSLGLRTVDQQPAQDAGAVPSPIPPPQVQGSPPMLATPRSQQESSRGVLIHHLVRSGQVIRHTGHIVVIGDVNAGAEIIAGGDVVIWGRLHGTVHAGAMGNNQAVVCALELAPLQLRIGDLVARPEESERTLGKKGPRKSGPEIASVRDAMIIVEPWERLPRGG